MTRSRLPLLLALVAVLLATATTAYSAGLAKNSVGTPQLKNKAVTTPKLKKNAVTGDKVKDRSLRARDLADGVLPAEGLAVRRELVTSPDDYQLGSLAGVSFRAQCNNASPDHATLYIEIRDGLNMLMASGIRVNRADAGTPVTGSTFATNATATTLAASPLDGGVEVEHGVLQVANGAGPTLQVVATIRVQDGLPTPCSVRLAVTPVS